MIVAMLVACGADKADPTTDTGDADADSDADADTGSTADTGTAAGRAGTYIGNLHVEVADIGFVVNNSSCDDPLFTLVVAPGAVPEISGSGQCTTTAPLAGQVFTAVLDGTLALDPVVSGDATITWPPVPYPLADGWSGSFTGPDDMTGTFQGYWQNGSQGFEWTATFEVTR